MREAVASLGAGASGEVVDLASFRTIIDFTDRVKAVHPRIDTLVDNAGIFIPTFGKTAEGFELTIGTNAIGTALLTHLLIPNIAASPDGRIVVLSSSAAAMAPGPKPWRRLADVGGESLTASTIDEYADSKLLNTLWANALQVRAHEAW